MPGLDPGIHVFAYDKQGEGVDGRDKPGHDSNYRPCERSDPYSVTYQFCTVLVANISMN